MSSLKSSPNTGPRPLVPDFGIAEVVDFVTRCKDKHKLVGENARQIEASLAFIEGKRKNSRLYLGMIGEASSGKSSLINAIIGAPLLVTDLIPGTTSAATVIQHSERARLSLELHNGDVFQFPEDGNLLSIFGYQPDSSDTENFRRIIAHATSKENISKLLKEIRVHLPLENLRSGLVIIDTPGINHSEKSHEEITAQTISERCDAAIVLVPSGTPVSQTLAGFLAGNLGRCLHRCLFVVSKIDLIRPERRERLLDNIRARVNRMLTLENPTVIPVSTLYETARYDEFDAAQIAQKTEEEVLGIKKSFTDFLNIALSKMNSQREVIVLERLLTTCQLMLTMAEEALGALNNRYMKEHEALERSIVERPEVYAKEMEKRFVANFRGTAASGKGELVRKLRVLQKKLLDNCHSMIQKMSSIEEVKENLEEALDKQFTKGDRKVKILADERARALDATCVSVLEEFDAEFTRLYDRLATLSGTIDSSTVRSSSTIRHGGNAARASRTGVSASVETAMKSIESKEGGRMGGLLIGTVMFFALPGIGAILAPFLMTWLGGLLGPSLDSIKEKVAEDIDGSVKDSYRKVRKELEKGYDISEKEKRKLIGRFIRQRFGEYNELLATMNERDAKLLQQTEARSREIGVELERVRDYTGRVSSLLTKLKNQQTTT